MWGNFQDVQRFQVLFLTSWENSGWGDFLFCPVLSYDVWVAPTVWQTHMRDMGRGEWTGGLRSSWPRCRRWHPRHRLVRMSLTKKGVFKQLFEADKRVGQAKPKQVSDEALASPLTRITFSNPFASRSPCCLGKLPQCHKLAGWQGKEGVPSLPGGISSRLNKWIQC